MRDHASVDAVLHQVVHSRDQVVRATVSRRSEGRRWSRSMCDGVACDGVAIQGSTGAKTTSSAGHTSGGTLRAGGFLTAGDVAHDRGAVEPGRATGSSQVRRSSRSRRPPRAIKNVDAGTSLLQLSTWACFPGVDGAWRWVVGGMWGCVSQWGSAGGPYRLSGARPQ